MKTISPHQFVWALALYIFLMGIVGFARTGSTIPILINGIIAAITFIISYMMYQKVNGARLVTILWLGASAGLYSYMTFFRVSAHADPRPGQPLIFGSMAVFAVVGLIVVARAKQ